MQIIECECEYMILNSMQFNYCSNNFINSNKLEDVVGYRRISAEENDETGCS